MCGRLIYQPLYHQIYRTSIALRSVLLYKLHSCGSCFLCSALLQQVHPVNSQWRRTNYRLSTLLACGVCYLFFHPTFSILCLATHLVILNTSSMCCEGIQCQPSIVSLDTSYTKHSVARYKLHRWEILVVLLVEIH